MARDGNDIFHHFHGIFENVSVYPLENVVLDFSAAEKKHFIRGVDMSVRDRLVRTVFAADLKNFTDFPNLLVPCHHSPSTLFINIFSVLPQSALALHNSVCKKDFIMQSRFSIV